jgi:hypothetical protein
MLRWLLEQLLWAAVRAMLSAVMALAAATVLDRLLEEELRHRQQRPEALHLRRSLRLRMRQQQQQQQLPTLPEEEEEEEERDETD